MDKRNVKPEGPDTNIVDIAGYKQSKRRDLRGRSRKSGTQPAGDGRYRWKPRDLIYGALLFGLAVYLLIMGG